MHNASGPQAGLKPFRFLSNERRANIGPSENASVGLTGMARTSLSR